MGTKTTLPELFRASFHEKSLQLQLILSLNQSAIASYQPCMSGQLKTRGDGWSMEGTPGSLFEPLTFHCRSRPCSGPGLFVETVGLQTTRCLWRIVTRNAKMQHVLLQQLTVGILYAHHFTGPFFLLSVALA